MRITHALTAVVAMLLVASAARSQAMEDQGKGTDSSIEVRQRPAVAALSGFVENHGQWADEVRFLARENGIEAVLLDDALVLHPLPRWPAVSRDGQGGVFGEVDELPGPPVQPERVPGPSLTIRFPTPQSVEGQGVGPTAHHFLLGSGFTRDVPGFERVVYRGVAPDIDLVVRTGGGWFAYDLQLRPGADLGALALDIEGADAAELVDDGVLSLQTSAGRVDMRIDAAWQVDPVTGVREAVASRFRVLDTSGDRVRLGFEAPGRDPSRAFVLDPSLVYATYVGGSGNENFIDMDVAPDGSVYLAARSVAGPTTPGAFQTEAVGVSDAWAGKLSADGSTLEWATYVGGAATESLIGLDLDKDGTVVLVGSTWSVDFPVTQGSLDTTHEGGPSVSDLFITRLAPDGGSLIWSTFYGGPSYDAAKRAALFPSGDVLIFADPVAPPPPATPGAFDTVFDNDDLYVARISADGTQLVFQTFFHGSAWGLAFDSESNIYIASVGGEGFTGTPGAFKETLTPGDPGDTAIIKMDALGTHIHWATLLGGDDNGELPLAGIALDAAGAVYVAGWTNSDDFPITTGAPGQNQTNGFVTKLLPGGTGLVWSKALSACCGLTTFLWDLAVDPAGDAYVSGNSNGANFPVTPDAFQPAYIGSGTKSDAHLTKLDAFGESLVYSTYFGGSSSDTLTQVGLDADQDVHLVVQTASNNIPVTPGAYDSDYSGNGDMVVARFTGIPVAPWRILGGGVAGSIDTPNLAGAGPLTPGSPTRLSVRGGAPSASAVLIVDLPASLFPSSSGLSLGPASLAVTLATTSVEGSLDLSFPWPTWPPGHRLQVQIWIRDPGAVGGWSATNKLRLITK